MSVSSTAAGCSSAGSAMPPLSCNNMIKPKKRGNAIYDSILDAIGETPLVKIHRVSAHALKNSGVELFAKCEFFNAGGSIKDRIGKLMIEQAEASGRLSPGDVLIEPTSGNTGIGLALAAAVKGYRCIITLPEKMSQEKVNVLKALGAEIIRTPTEAAWDSPESHISVAKQLNLEIPNSHILDQYTNEANPNAHYEFTAEEILKQCGGQVDMLVAGVGTGGTITGMAKKLKEKCPDVIIVGVDPVGSILAQPEELNDVNRLQPYQIEGIGYDFIPSVLDRSLVDVWAKSNDKESFIMARRLIREEGLLCGGSSGSAMVAALEHAAKLKPGQKCVVILSDSTRNYMTKFLNDQWMFDNSYVGDTVHTADNYQKYRKTISTWWSKHTVSQLGLNLTPSTILPSVSCREAIDQMQKSDFDQLPVVDLNGVVLGVTTIGNLLSKVSSGRTLMRDSIGSTMYKTFKTVTLDTPLSHLAEEFDSDYFIIVVSTSNTKDENPKILSLATRIDLLNYITTGEGVGAET